MDDQAEAISILIATTTRFFRRGCASCWRQRGTSALCGEAGDGEDTLKLVRELKPAILLLDLTMPRRAGLDALRELVKLSTPVRTILLAAAVEKVQLVEAIQLHQSVIEDKT